MTSKSDEQTLDGQRRKNKVADENQAGLPYSTIAGQKRIDEETPRELKGSTMAKNRLTSQQIDTGVRLLSKLPTPVIVLGLLVIGAVFLISQIGPLKKTPAPAGTKGPPGTYLICSWNAENFFDDHDDPKIDDEMENWFGQNPEMFEKKIDHLSNALLLMNDGVGPDVFALVEVENLRCFEKLRDALNTKLEKAGKPDKKYEHVLFVGDNTGRHFAPGMISRIAPIADRTRKLGKRGNGRIIEGHLNANGHELVVISAHWTSRVTDQKGDRRMSYAEDCYGRVRAILTANPDADIIVCGDFNDDFKDVSIQEGLHASSNFDEVKKSVDQPKLYSLFADWSGDPKGTIYGKGKWSIFDHMCVTRGLLDQQGWSLDPTTAAIFAPSELRTGKAKTPFRFGDAKTTGQRGFADHFPIVVRLSVAGSAE